MIYSRTTFLVLGLVVLASGCRKRLEFADTVEGTLTLDGKPVPQALVEFIPEPQGDSKVPRSSSVTDAQGFFRLTREDNGQAGAVVGTHRVVVHPGRPAGSRKRGKGDGDQIDVGKPQPATIKIPPTYMSAAQTPLKVEVTKDQK